MILPGFFNPLQILTGPEFDLIFFILFMILFLIYFFTKSKLEVLLTFTIIGVFILFSIGVHFVTKDIAIGVRNVHPTFLICALCFWKLFYNLKNIFIYLPFAIKHFKNIGTIICLSFCFITIIPATYNVFKVSLNASLEYYFTKRIILHNFNVKDKNIYVFSPNVPGETIIAKNKNFIKYLPNNFLQSALNYSVFRE